MVQFQRKNKRQLEIISMRKTIVSLVILLVIRLSRCSQLNDDSCPENSSLSPQGTCECDLNYFKVSNDANKFACKKCIECKEECQGRNFRCNENKVHNSNQSCISPRKGYFVLYSEMERCRPECGRNEKETVKCRCNQNRRCECKDDLYKDSQGACTKQCTKCLSRRHKRVPAHLGCTQMLSNENCVEKTPAPTPTSTPASTPKTTEKILVQTSEEKKKTHHNFTKKPFISKARNTPNPNLRVDDGEERVKKYKLYFPPLVCGFFAVIAMAFGIYKLYKRYRKNHMTVNYQEAEEIMPLAIQTYGDTDTPSTVVTGTSDQNSNILPNFDFAKLVGQIPKEILDLVAEYWSSRFKRILEMPCTKAEKDAYIKVAFEDDKDQSKIIRFTDKKECNYSRVMAYVKTRKPEYTLEKLLQHMFESNNYDLVKMLAEEIMDNKEMYMKDNEVRCAGSSTINICVER